MARYGMDYDRGFREGADWDRDDFTAGTRQYNTMHNEWHIDRGRSGGARGGAWDNRPVAGSYDSHGGGYGARGSFDYGRPNRNPDQGGYGEAGWSGWSGSRGGHDLGGGSGSSGRGYGGLDGRGYDVDDFQRFTAGPDRSHPGGRLPASGYTGGYSGGGYSGGGYSGGGYSGGGYTGGGSSGWNSGYQGGYTGDLGRGTQGYGAGNWSRDYGSDFGPRGYDHDLGDRVREGWDHLRDRARSFFRR